MAVSAAQIKELRVATGAGILDCKKALQQTDGSIEAAVDFLRKKGLASAAKKTGRAATEGLVTSYIHGEGRIGVLLEVNCETDFVARTDGFKSFTRDIAMHIAASAPGWVRREEVPAEMVAREKAVLVDQARATGKPEMVIEKIVVGRLNKFYAENCLLEQKFIKDPDHTIQDILTAQIAKLGENMSIRRFSRFVLGEGLEKKEDDFAAEVARQVSQT